MSLRQIAQELGLSVTTVSRALAGYGDVSQQTRDRVVAEADRIGYVPNEVARRLQKGRSDAVGLVIPDSHGGLDDPFFIKVIDGAARRASELDMDLVVVTALPTHRDLRSQRRLVEGGRIDGLILTRLVEDDPRLQHLLDRRFPFVAFSGAPGADPRVTELCIDESSAVEAALDHLHTLGHRSIALLSSHAPFTFVKRREEAYRDAIARRGLRPRIARGPMNEQGGYDEAAALLLDQRRPTAMLASTDAIALGVLRAARLAGLSVPHDLSIVSMGDSPGLRISQPPMTAIRIPIADMAAQAVDLIVSLRDYGQVPAPRAHATELVIRDTTAAPRH
jgi:LacI family transcriptional regulator